MPYLSKFRLNGELSKKGGIFGNKGNLQGQVIRGADEHGHTIGDNWYAMFLANALAPAPYKMTDPEITERMLMLFPSRREVFLFQCPWKWRNCYNRGRMRPQKGTPPNPEHYSYRYDRIYPPEDMLEGPEDGPPYEVYAFSHRGSMLYRAYPREPDFRLKELSHVMNVPKPDFEHFPFPKAARSQYRDIRRERLEKEREAFQAFAQKWIKEQRALRPNDFDPLLWKDVVW